MLNVIACGCGALGSRIALEVARDDIEMILIDDDIVSRNNIPTSIYAVEDVDSLKVSILAEEIWLRKNCRAKPLPITLERNVSAILSKYGVKEGLVIDTFDNPHSRLLTALGGIPTIHAGVSESRDGFVAWNGNFPISNDEIPRGENPVCTNHLGQKILALTAAVAVTAILEYFESQAMPGFLIRESGVVVRR